MTSAGPHQLRDQAHPRRSGRTIRSAPCARLDEVVVDEAKVVEQVRELSALDIGLAIFDSPHRQQRHRGGHRKTEFDVVAGVVPTAPQVSAHVRAVVQP